MLTCFTTPIKFYININPYAANVENVVSSE